MEYEQKYTVALMDQVFTLTRSQIEFDSPNYFTMCFLGDFIESQSRRLQLSRDPELFRIIVKYLSGYSVLPANGHSPCYIAPATLANLRVDALFYQLDDLVHQCDEILESQERGAVPKYVAVGGIVSAQNGKTDVSDLRCISREFKVFVSPSDITQEPFTKLTRLNAAGGPSGFFGLQFMGAIGDILANKLGQHYHDDWRLLGWSTEPCPDADTCNQLVILAERVSSAPKV